MNYRLFSWIALKNFYGSNPCPWLVIGLFLQTSSLV
jgi:hypothetical protein